MPLSPQARRDTTIMFFGAACGAMGQLAVILDSADLEDATFTDQQKTTLVGVYDSLSACMESVATMLDAEIESNDEPSVSSDG